MNADAPSDAETARIQFESVRAGLCPDCGANLPPRAAHCATIQCRFCSATWSIEHRPEPPRDDEP